MKKKIVVVGAGSAGWITLAYLMSTLSDHEFTIIYDTDVDAIGVGETTTPGVRLVAQTVGVDEFDWIRSSQGCIKYGVRFDNWNLDNTSWFHNFDDLIPGHTYFDPPSDISKNNHYKKFDSVSLNLSLYKNGEINHKDYNRNHGPQQDLLDLHLSPFDKDYKSNISQWPGYSYQINAFKFGHALKSAIDSRNQPYRIINSKVENFEQDQNGFITSLITKSGEIINCDLVFDCSGFTRSIIGKLTDFIEYDDMICNRAIVGIAEINHHELCTKAVAQPHGWIWETPTYRNMGSGYVYSDKFSSDEDAEQVFLNYWKEKNIDIKIMRKIKFTSGRMRDICVKNVISNGLSQNFIEPLEATSIMLTCNTIIKFVKHYKKNNCSWSNLNARAFSSYIDNFLKHTKKFVLYHYTLSKRRDTDFWKYWGNLCDTENHINEYNRYIEQYLKTGRMAEKGDTIINQFNLASMLIGLNVPCYIDFNFTKKEIDRFKFVNQLNKLNYLNLVEDNIPNEEFLKKIHGY